MSTSEGRRSERLAARLGSLCEVPLHRDEEPGPGARARLVARRSPTRSARCSRCSACSAMRRFLSAVCTSSTPGHRPSATPRRSSNCSPPGKYKPVTRLRHLRQRAGADRHVPLLRRRRHAGGSAAISSRCPPSRPARGRSSRRQADRRCSSATSTLLDARIKAIEKRDRPAEPGDDILLSVITDGRHAAIDLRLVDAGQRQ